MYLDKWALGVGSGKWGRGSGRWGEMDPRKGVRRGAAGGNTPRQILYISYTKCSGRDQCKNNLFTK